jgi:GntR family transcriptional regulator, trigonelline degradation regulator
MTPPAAAIEALRIDSPLTLRELALDRMRGAIVDGTFPPGTRLVERTLCEYLGVSRSVIREVLRHLEAEDLIEMARQGPVVASIDADQARQIYDIRAALEPAAAAGCARTADDAAIARLHALLDELDAVAADGDPVAMLTGTVAFYAEMFATSGHSVAWDIVSRLNGRISRLRRLTLGTSNRTVSGPARMRAILEAIERHDPEAAAAACREHVAEAARIAARILDGAATEP